LFFANAAASVVALVLGIPATSRYGLRGVIWSMVIANVLYVAVAFILLGQRLNANATAEQPAEEMMV
jgi:type VI protein secretion system component VasF